MSLLSKLARLDCFGKATDRKMTSRARRPMVHLARFERLEDRRMLSSHLEVWSGTLVGTNDGPSVSHWSLNYDVTVSLPGSIADGETIRGGTGTFSGVETIVQQTTGSYYEWVGRILESTVTDVPLEVISSVVFDPSDPSGTWGPIWLTADEPLIYRRVLYVVTGEQTRTISEIELYVKEGTATTLDGTWITVGQGSSSNFAHGTFSLDLVNPSQKDVEISDASYDEEQQIVTFNWQTTGIPGTFDVGLYLSDDERFDASDQLAEPLIQIEPQSGSDSDSGTGQFHLSGPLTGVRQPFALVVADPKGRIQETSEDNNTVEILVRKDVAITGAVYDWDGRDRVDFQYQTNGNVESFDVGIYLSYDRVFNNDDIIVGDLKQIAPGGGSGSNHFSLSEPLDHSDVQGRGYALVVADPLKTITERDEDNNDHSFPIKLVPPTITLESSEEALRKRGLYYAYANFENQGTVPLKVRLHWEESFFGQLSRTGQETVQLGAEQQLHNVSIDKNSRTWDWIPPDDPIWTSKDTVGLYTNMLVSEGLKKALGKAGGAVAERLKTIYEVVEAEVSAESERIVTYKAEDVYYDRQDAAEFSRHIGGFQILTSNTTLRVGLKGQFHLGASVVAKALGSGLLTVGIAATAAQQYPVAAVAAAAGVVELVIAHHEYLQAVDPPDPNYTEIATPTAHSVPEIENLPDGFWKTYGQLMLELHALKVAESISRDRALGAAEAEDAVWESRQWIAAADFAAQAAAIESRSVGMHAYFEPYLADLLADRGAEILASLQTDGLPEFSVRVLTELGWTPAQIDMLRQNLLQLSAEEFEDVARLGNAQRAAALVSAFTAIEDLWEGIQVRVDDLGEPVRDLTSQERQALDAAKTAIEKGLAVAVPDESVMYSLLDFVDDARNLVKETNNPDALQDYLDFAYGTLVSMSYAWGDGRQFEAHFDFGTDSSPVAASYSRATYSEYTPEQGYGWLPGGERVGSMERQSGSALQRDFVHARDATFVVDLPLLERTYDVTVHLGDTLNAHERMGIFLEGNLVDTVDTAAGQVVNNTYSVTVADGQLTLRLDDLGGTDDLVTLVGLEVVTQTGENLSPTDVSLSNGTVEENSPNGTQVGNLSASDPDPGDVHTFSLLDDAGGRFAVSGSQLVVADGGLLDFETSASHDVTVRATDFGGLTFDKSFAIAVSNVDELPVVLITESDNSTDVSEDGATDGYTVVLTSQPTADVTISITAGSGSQLSISPASLAFTAGNWNQEQTVIVSAVDDAVAEGPHTARVTHAAASTDSNYNGIALASVTAKITDNDAESLGPIDFLELGGLDPSAGDLVYRLKTAHQALFTAEVSPPDVALTLYDQNGADLTTSAPVDGNQRIDWQSDAGVIYYLKLSGAASEVDLRLANLVNHEGTSLTVFGTESDDRFEFDASVSRDITINGVHYAFTNDEVTTVTFDAGGGRDTVFLTDSPADDTLDAWPGTAKFAGSGFSVETTNFEMLQAYARAGGHDVANMYDSEGEDKFKSKAKEKFSLLRDRENKKFFHRAKFFELVEAHSRSGKDKALFFDSKATDFFTGQRDESRLTSPSEGLETIAHNFSQVIARAGSGGTDIATFKGSDSWEEFHGKPHKAEMFDLTATRDVYKITARGFREYHAEATRGASDKAKLWGTSRDDYFQAAEDWARFFVQNEELDLLYEVIAFDLVKVRSTEGGKDKADILHPLAFTYILGDGWEES